MDSAYLQTSLRKLWFVSNFHDARVIVYDIVLDGSQWISQIRGRGDTAGAADSLFDDNNAILPTAHWSFHLLVGLFIVSFLLRSFWILKVGIWVILADQIIGIASDWIFYTLDDPELSFAIRYVRGWFSRAIKESESILKNEATWKMGVAHAFLQQVPTGISVIRYYIFYRTFELRDIFLNEELGATRYATRDESLRFLPRGESWTTRYRERKQYIQDDESDRSPSASMRTTER